MVVIDFSKLRNSREVGELIANYFGLNVQAVIEELTPYVREDYDLLQFIEKFNIDLERSYQKETQITCRHATTAFDGLKMLREKGLLNLKQMLEGLTPLSKFLFQQGITVNVDGQTLMFNGMCYPILKSSDVCNQCIFEACLCNSIFTGKPTYKGCEYRNALSVLYSKLYHDQCEIEVFVDAEIDDIYDYDSVRYSPEILNTLEQIIDFYDGKTYNLQNAWRDLPNNHYYILEFDAPIEAFDDATIKSAIERYWDIEEVAEAFGYSEWDFEENKISRQFYFNLFLLRNFIDKFTWGEAKKFGQLLPETEIPGDSIRVIREHPIHES